MKTNVFILVALVLGFNSSQGQNTLTVTIDNIQEAKGSLRVGLFDNADNFLKESREGKIVKASAGAMTIEFDNLVSGDYAVSVIHDLNENGELDSNFIGIPTEPYGFSNNAMGNFGPPSFEKAKFKLAENLTTSISLR